MKSTARKVLAALALAMVALMFSATAASAANTVTPNSNVPDGPGPHTAQLTYDNTSAAQSVFVMLCNNTAAISASNLYIECAQSTETEYFALGGPIDTANPSLGQDPFPFVVAPSGVDWQCSAAGNTGGTIVQGGKRLFSRCSIRFSPASTTNVDGDEFGPMDFAADPGTPVPEAPMVILMPLAGLAVAGAAYFVLRSRRPALQL